MIRIRMAEEPDIPDVLKLEQAVFSPPWSEGTLLGQLGRDDGCFALAVEEGTGDALLGFVITRRAADEAELYQIAVREDRRRRGVAGLLMEAALADCRKHGAAEVWLEVRRGNNAAICLYKKFGFTAEGRRKNYYSSPVEDAVVMSRLLRED